MEKRHFKQADLGLDIHHLDGYRVVYEDINRVGGKTVVRLLDDQGNVMLMLKSAKNKSNVYAYAEMIKLYLEPKGNEKFELIKKLNDDGMSRKEIAEKLGMVTSTINDYFRYYNLNHMIEYGEEKRFSTNEFLGIDLNILDGYRVSYEYVNQKYINYIARLHDEDDDVIAMSRTVSDSKIMAYALLVQSYDSPKKDTQIKKEAIKSLYNAGMSKTHIAKTLKISSAAVNDYFYFYNLDNRNKF
ncbi:hypothetical protein CIRMBP1294_02359 [Enterococcus cecorum]|nr:hypothetical protein CIRMBP1294_02359 [Enterococcus cecorum]